MKRQKNLIQQSPIEWFEYLRLDSAGSKQLAEQFQVIHLVLHLLRFAEGRRHDRIRQTGQASRVESYRMVNETETKCSDHELANKWPSVTQLEQIPTFQNCFKLKLKLTNLTLTLN